MKYTIYLFSSILCLWCLLGCRSSINDNELSTAMSSFEIIKSDKSKLTFSNDLVFTEEMNVYTFRNFYNGSGVAVGDMNNDGLEDIYFTGNQKDNKLYINKGDFVFEDVTAWAGVGCPDIWSTGASIVDVNGDGLLDIYVCKSGPPGGKNRHNELFINQGDLSFKEMSHQYGLDFLGLSIHAAFFDYDLDGDLDCYLLNNSLKSVGNFTLRKGQRHIPDENGGNKLLRNDAGRFVDVTQSAGILSSSIGFGLGVTISDLNKDGYPDIYVSNDFFEKDYLYYNNGDGTFREDSDHAISEMSMGSMGADIADLDNDGLAEIFVTDMLPESNERLKTKTQFENWKKYQRAVDAGYHHQFTRNVLQKNNGDGTFNEISRISGVSATDWSWGALLFDMDQDGLKDIFVANGIVKDLTDQDYVNFTANESAIREMIKDENEAIKKLIDLMPSKAIPNYAFLNKGGLAFEDATKVLALNDSLFSTGSSYADLDNDGDLDLILNNVNSKASIYRNNASDQGKDWIALDLKCTGLNPFCTGARVELYDESNLQVSELFPQRGYQSTVTRILHFGLTTKDSLVDSILIYWPNKSMIKLENIPTNSLKHISEDSLSNNSYSVDLKQQKSLFKKSSLEPFDYEHIENPFNDFDREPLLLSMSSNETPKGKVIDINDDGLDDIIIASAAGNSSRILFQNTTGEFDEPFIEILSKHKAEEHTDIEVADFDGDGFQDFYFTSGGSALPQQSSLLKDLLLFGDGSVSNQSLPSFQYQNSSCVASSDIDGDGDVDLFVGVRSIPFLYGIPPDGYLLINNGDGTFEVDKKHETTFSKIGMLTNAMFSDVDDDGDQDLVTSGLWTPITIYENVNGQFSKVYKSKNGLWHNFIITDVNGDGKPDIVAANQGENTILKASESHPLRMWINDFDKNGSIEQITTMFEKDAEYPLHLRHDLVARIPILSKKFPNYKSYKDARIQDLFSEEVLNRSIVHNVENLKSTVMLNQGNFEFVAKPLPREAQTSVTYAVLANDINNDGVIDLVLGGNNSKIKPELGIQMANRGVILLGNGEGDFNFLSFAESGINVSGEVRTIMESKIGKKKYLIFLRNNQSSIFYELDQ